MTDADPRTQLSKALDAVIREGSSIYLKYSLKNLDSSARKQMAKQLGLAPETAVDKDGAKAPAAAKPSKTSDLAVLLDELPTFDFGDAYQRWYSKALRTVEQLLPDRYDEFRSLYRPEKRRAIDVETYGICDAIHNITVTTFGKPAFPVVDIVATKLQQQVSILKSAQDRLSSILTDIQAVLQAGLLDEELAGARELLRAGHVRSSGVIAGVVLERHLRGVRDAHQVADRKRPTIANLNDALKKAGVVDVPRWRHIQHLADLRNLCAHDGDRPPTADEVERLISGVDQIVRTTF